MSSEGLTFSNILKYPATQGLYGGLLLSAFSAIIYIFGISVYNPWFGLISFALTFGIAITFMYRGAAGFRNNVNNRIIDYWTATLLLFISGVVMYYISAIFGLILNTVIDPTYPDTLFRQAEEMYASMEIPEEMRSELLAKTKENMQPMKQFLTALYSNPIVAIVLSLIISFFVRKKADKIQSQPM